MIASATAKIRVFQISPEGRWLSGQKDDGGKKEFLNYNWRRNKIKMLCNKCGDKSVKTNNELNRHALFQISCLNRIRTRLTFGLGVFFFDLYGGHPMKHLNVPRGSNDNLKLTTCDNRILTTLSGERKAG
jgi:hypothetical protein